MTDILWDSRGTSKDPMLGSSGFPGLILFFSFNFVLLVVFLFVCFLDEFPLSHRHQEGGDLIQASPLGSWWGQRGSCQTGQSLPWERLLESVSAAARPTLRGGCWPKPALSSMCYWCYGPEQPQAFQHFSTKLHLGCIWFLRQQHCSVDGILWLVLFTFFPLCLCGLDCCFCRFSIFFCSYLWFP